MSAKQMDTTPFSHTLATNFGASSFLSGLYLTAIGNAPTTLLAFFLNFVTALAVGLIVMFLTWLFKPIVDAYWQPVLDRLGILYRRDAKKEIDTDTETGAEK